MENVMSNNIYHNHHIIPKHAGGTDAPDNIARLTTTEHAEAHRLLYEEYGRWQDKIAYQALAGYIGKEEIIAEMIKNRPAHTEQQKRLIGEATIRTWTGRNHSEETKEQMSESSKGSKNGMFGKHPIFSTETKKKMSEGAKNRKRYPASEETKKKMSVSSKNRKRNSKGHFIK